MGQKIIIQDINKPKNKKIKEEVRWICNSLGLKKGRDLEDMSFKIVFKLLNLFSKNDLISTEEVSKSLKIESHIVNHHLRCLMESGIFFREKRKIALRGGSLSAAIEKMKRDSDMLFMRLLESSKKVDKFFDLI